MYLLRAPHAATVILGPSGWMTVKGSEETVSVAPFSTLKIWRVAGKPIRGSVTRRINLSSSENCTRLTAVLNSHDFKHFPFETSQSLAVLSADPETKSVVVASSVYRCMVSENSYSTGSGCVCCLKAEKPMDTYS